MPCPSRPKPAAPLAVAIAWALALFAIAAARYRGRVHPYHRVHEWLAERGVPDAVRNLDYIVIMLGAAALGGVAAVLLARVRFADALALRRPRPTWIPMLLAAGAPMVLGGLVLMLERHAALPGGRDLFKAVVQAPIVEEVVFRGALFALPLAVLGTRVFWSFAVASALCFGAIHVTWTLDGVAAGWANLLVTAAGGLWYAWLVLRWRSLAVTVGLHAAMNLGWMLAGTTAGAGGGGLAENILRAATITIATAWTFRKTPPVRPKKPQP